MSLFYHAAHLCRHIQEQLFLHPTAYDLSSTNKIKQVSYLAFHHLFLSSTKRLYAHSPLFLHRLHRVSKVSHPSNIHSIFLRLRTTKHHKQNQTRHSLCALRPLPSLPSDSNTYSCCLCTLRKRQILRKFQQYTAHLPSEDPGRMHHEHDQSSEPFGRLDLPITDRTFHSTNFQLLFA